MAPHSFKNNLSVTRRVFFSRLWFFFFHEHLFKLFVLWTEFQCASSCLVNFIEKSDARIANDAFMKVESSFRRGFLRLFAAAGSMAQCRARFICFSTVKL